MLFPQHLRYRSALIICIAFHQSLSGHEWVSLVHDPQKPEPDLGKMQPEEDT